MHIPEQPPKRELENLLPLVNVVFLLLIFFMVAGAFSSPELFTITPTVAENDSVVDQKLLKIVMNEQGELGVGEKVIPYHSLHTIVNDHLSLSSSNKVQLKPDANVEASLVVELLEYLSKTDLNAVHIVTSAPR